MDFCPSNGCRLLFPAGTDPSTTINIPERIIIWYIGQILIRLTVIYCWAILLRSVALNVAKLKEETGPYTAFSSKEALAGYWLLSVPLNGASFCEAFVRHSRQLLFFVLYLNGCIVSSLYRIFHSSGDYGSSSTEQLASDSQICRKHKGCSRVQKNHRGDGQTTGEKILNWLWSRQNQHHLGTGICFSEVVISVWHTALNFSRNFCF